MNAPTLMYDRVGDNVVTVDVGILLGTRLLAQANSGGGKSRLIRSLLEQTHGKVQHLVIDSEGEFGTLREKFSYVLASKEGDVPAHPKVAKVLCRRLIEIGASAILDIYDLSLVERREFVKLFLNELMTLPRSLWKPVIIVIDEAHNFAPQSGEAQSTDAVITLCTQGRKRGFCAVLATQRISKLHKDAAAELNNKLIGRTGLDVDQKRAGDDLGFDKEQRIALRDLPAGSFYAFGPAMGNGVQLVQTAPVLTTHPDANSIGSIMVPASATVRSLVDQIGDLPKLADKERDERVALEQRVRELHAQLRAKPQAVVQGITEDEVQRRIDEEVDAAIDRSVADAFAAGSNAVLESLRAMIAGWEPKQPELTLPVQRKPEVRSAQPTIAKTQPPKAEYVRAPEGSVTLSKTMRRMLSVLVQLDSLGVEWPEKRTMAGWSGVSHTTGTFSNQMRGLRDSGSIEVQGDRVRITDAGRVSADDAPPIASLDELHEIWQSKFSATVAKMFRALVEMSGKRMRAVAKADLAAAVGVSHTTGTFSNQLRELRTPGVIEDADKQHIRLTALVFPEGLS